MPDPKRQLIVWFICGWVVSLNGESQNNLDDDDFSMNFTTLWDILKPQGPNPFLHELNGHWSFNDTIDISKYEDFDHTRFESMLDLQEFHYCFSTSSDRMCFHTVVETYNQKGLFVTK